MHTNLDTGSLRIGNTEASTCEGKQWVNPQIQNNVNLQARRASGGGEEEPQEQVLCSVW